jgi:hypothetical protein
MVSYGCGGLATPIVMALAVCLSEGGLGIGVKVLIGLIACGLIVVRIDIKLDVTCIAEFGSSGQ